MFVAMDGTTTTTTGHTVHIHNQQTTNPTLPMDVAEWPRAMASRCIRASDIQRLRRGETIELLVMRRDMRYRIETDNAPDVAIPAADFFRFCQCVYTQGNSGGLCGSLKYLQQPLHLEVAFCFQVQNPNTLVWCPTLESADNPLVGWQGPMMRWSDVPDALVYWTSLDDDENGTNDSVSSQSHESSGEEFEL